MQSFQHLNTAPEVDQIHRIPLDDDLGTPKSPQGLLCNGNFSSIQQCKDVDERATAAHPQLAAVISPEKKNCDLETLQQELLEARRNRQEAVEALQQLQEAVRIVTRQLKEQPQVVAVTPEGDGEVGDNDVPSLPCDFPLDSRTPTNNLNLRCSNDMLPLQLPSLTTVPNNNNQHFPPSYVCSNRHRTWSAGTAASNMSSAGNTTAGTSSSLTSVVSFCSQDELRLAQLLSPISSSSFAAPSSSSSVTSSCSSLPPDVAADVMNLVNAAHMVRDHAKWATMDVALLVEETQQLQETYLDAVQRAQNMEETCHWYQTQLPPLCQQLVQAKAEKKSLKKVVKQLQQQLQQQQEEMRLYALEHHVLKALHLHEQRLGRNASHSASTAMIAMNEQDDLAFVERNADDNASISNNSVAATSVSLNQIDSKSMDEEQEEEEEKKEDEPVIVNTELPLPSTEHSSSHGDTVDDSETSSPLSSSNVTNPESAETRTKYLLDEKLSNERGKTHPTNAAATPRGLGFGAAGALGFGAFNMHKSWGAPSKPPMRPTAVRHVQNRNKDNPSRSTLKTSANASNPTAATETIKADAIAHGSNKADKEPSMKATDTGSSSKMDDANNDQNKTVTKPQNSYEPIKLLDRRSSTSPISWMSPRDGGDNDLGSKVMKFFQSRTSSKSDDINKAIPGPPRLQLGEDENDDGDDQGEDPTARSCSSLSLNASLSPETYSDHFAPRVHADKNKLFLPEMPQSPHTNPNQFAPVTHVTCSYNLPPSALTSPKDSPAMSSESFMSRNAFFAIRSDQNVLRSLAIPETVRPSYQKQRIAKHA